jgi:hypothetical protein
MIGINFHTGDTVAARDESKPCRYATFWTSPKGYNIHPIGYAEKMFSLGGQGRLVPATVTNQDNLNLTIYTALFGQKTLYVTFINREHGTNARAANVTIVPGFDNSRGQVIFMTAPGGDVSSKTGVTLGGAEIRDDAVWRGKWTALPKPSRNGQFSLKLPAASAALVKFTAR